MSHLPTNEIAKLALSGALTHGFVAILIFTLLAFFLKDQPLKMDGKPEGVDQEEQEVAKEWMYV